MRLRSLAVVTAVALVQRKIGSGAWRTIKKIRTTKKRRYATRITVQGRSASAARRPRSPARPGAGPARRAPVPVRLPLGGTRLLRVMDFGGPGSLVSPQVRCSINALPPLAVPH